MAGKSVTAGSNASPYFLKAPDLDVLAQSDGFKVLREHLAQTYSYRLCDKHEAKHLKNVARWLVVRDVLHALLVPIVELFDKASTLAAFATHATRLDDLENAFSEQARPAFLWLQCFLSSEREREWCYTRGCPVCVVEHSLHSEFSIRMLYTACLLSDVHYPFILEGPKLPSFRFFLETIERALAADSLYGPNFLVRMESKAIDTRNGIEELIHQCVELEAALSPPSSPSDSGTEAESAATSARSSPVLVAMGSKPPSERSGVRLKRGRAATRQMSLQMEEEQWMEEMMSRCSISLPSPEPNDFTKAPSRNLSRALKTKPAVTVTQISGAD